MMKRFATPMYAMWCAIWLGLAGGVAPAAAQDFTHWQQRKPHAGETVPHQSWDDLLARYARNGEDGITRFDYQAVPAADYAKLQAYIAMLENTMVTDLAAAQQMAYWINLYNAVTVRVILDHYPVDSIRDIGFGWASWLKKGPWQEKLTMVEGMQLSLDDIEHRIVRPVFGDNRVHYAFNCASIGCPNLPPRAYTADNLEAMLDAAARQYINHPRGARFVDDKLIVSSLFQWYAEDFGANQRQVLAHIKHYAQPSLRQRLQRVNAIDDFFYDWALNDARAVAQ